MEKKRVLLIAIALLIVLRLLLPPSAALRRKTELFFGLDSETVQTLGRSLKGEDRERYAASTDA